VEGEEQMITLTCGHNIEDLDDANYLALASFTREHKSCIDYVTYCDECTAKALDRGEVLLTVDDEDVWLQARSIKDEGWD
jgi:mRNA deadenylase 3'-5' endonuclease subunit Ccr4